ncbi:MAG: type II toxin-antitoxin system VapB family antitoxin [Ignavibacteriaceae bacterium]
MDTAKIFENGKSQAVRLPKAYRLKGKEAYITKIGDAIILLPKRSKWDSLVTSLEKFSDDFMSDRIQPGLENRDRLFE